MRVRSGGITRRRVVAAGAAGLALGSVPAVARPLFLPGGTPQAGPPPVSGGMSRTFANTAGTATPSDVPILCEMHFVPGDVPSGYIAVPQFGGVDVVYNANRIRTWDQDGSLKSVTFAIAHNQSISAGGTVQFAFDVRAGSYDKTSAITAADVAAATDYKLAVSNLHTSKVGDTFSLSKGFPIGNVLTVQIDGDQVVGIKEWYYHQSPVGVYSSSANATATSSIDDTVSGGVITTSAPNNTFYGSMYYLVDSEIIYATSAAGSTITYTLRGQFGTTPATHSIGATVRMLIPISNDQGGTGAFIYWVNSSATILLAGSGYAYCPTSSFTKGFNDIVADVSSGGNHANGVSVDQYYKGDVCNAFRAVGVIAGVPHAHATFYIERWNKADGSFLCYRAVGRLGNGLMDTANNIPNYTFDLDWKNGASVIRGASIGNTKFQTVQMYTGAGGFTVDDDGRADWSVNGDAYNAVIVQMTPDEADYFRATGVEPAMLSGVVPSVTVPSTVSDWETGPSYQGRSNIGGYQPFMGSYGLRIFMGSSAGSNEETNMSEIDYLLWYAWKNNKPSEAKVWLRNSRVAAMTSTHYGQTGGPMLETTTMRPPNVLPSSVISLSGMTPTRESFNILNAPPSGIATTGYCSPIIAGGTNQDFVSGLGSSTYHQVCCTYGPFLIEGDQWVLDTLLYAATSPQIAPSTTRRQGSFDGRTYYGLYCNTNANYRQMAWKTRTEIYAASALPSTWDDGSALPERAYLMKGLQEKGDWYNNLVPFLGSVTFGTTNPVTKSIDMTGFGIWPEDFSPSVYINNAFGGEVNYMLEYVVGALAHGYVLHNGSATGTALYNFLRYLLIAYAKRMSAPGASQMLHDAYRLQVWDTTAHDAIADATWTNFDPADPKKGVVPIVGSSTVPRLNFTSGNSTIAMTAGPMVFNQRTGEQIASGTRIKLTAADLNNTTITGVTPPTPFSETPWYYLNILSSTTIQLCTDAALLNPVTPTASASGVYFWLVPANTLPANSTGDTYRHIRSPNGNSTTAATLGYLRMAKWAIGDPDGFLTSAISNMTTLANAGGITYTDEATYAFDDA